MRVEHFVEARNLSPNLCLGRPHFRILLEKPAQGSLEEPAAVAASDQVMTDAARGPVAHAFPNYTSACVSREALGRISPSDIRL
jgi:hypothetical protein